MAGPSGPPGWVHLLDLTGGQALLLVGGGQAACSVRAWATARGIQVVQVTPSVSLPSDLRRLPPEPSSYDVVVLQGVHPTRALLSAAAALLTPHGRFAVLVDQASSPLRCADRIAGRPTGPVALHRTARLRRDLGRLGLTVTELGLLRSSVAPVTAVDLDGPAVVQAVLRASQVHVGGSRGHLLAALARAGQLRTPALRWLLPGRLLLATRGPTGADAGITGMIANRDSVELKLLRGPGPDAVEKVYADEQAAGREAHALSLLGEAGVQVAPALLARPAPDRTRMTWLAGQPLALDRLSDADLAGWAARAGAVLHTIQQATRRADGSVLCHGDFWLGNLLVDRDRIVGVLDWTEATWGDPDTDRQFLAASLQDRLAASVLAAVLAVPDAAPLLPTGPITSPWWSGYDAAGRPRA